MPDYVDGTAAKIGDLVTRPGYNIKHEIICNLVNVRPGESCALSVAYVGATTPVHATINPETAVGDLARVHAPVHVVAELEYGDTKYFTKIA
jgi:hypothetical protein